MSVSGAESQNRLWSSLEELLDPASQPWIEAEFPTAASFSSEPARREFLRLMGTSLMLGGLSACSEGPSDLALPYVNQPEQEVVGVPRYFASAVTFEGYAQPVLARTNSGRPTKLDGNPDHPATAGNSDVFMQAAVLQLYDPDRSKAPVREGITSTWASFERELAALRQHWTSAQGEGLRILTGDSTSPTLIRLFQSLLASFPKVQVHVFEPVGSGFRKHAMQAAFGRDVVPHYMLDTCEVIVSLDDDLLGPGPYQVAHARGFAEKRGEMRPGQGRSRLHVAESVPSLTGAVASTRIAIDASRIPAMAAAIAAGMGAPIASPELTPPDSKWIEQVVRELKEHAGRSLLTCGAHLPPAVQALAPWINERLGNVGQTVTYTDAFALSSEHLGTLADLARDMAAGRVSTLVILDCNPVYTASGAMQFAALLDAIPTRIHAGLYQDETALRCHWHLPLTHALESWDDARAVDGTATIIQPLVRTLYSARTFLQIVAMLSGSIDPAAEQIVRATWTELFADGFETRWKQSLHDGFVARSASAPLNLTASTPGLGGWQSDTTSDAIDVLFRPDPCVWDGRFANVAWLQELPKPLTKITWDCPIAVSPRMADDLKLANGDLVEVSVDGRSVVGPAWIMPGQASRTVALFLGYGRATGEIAAGLGFTAYAVRPVENPWLARGHIRRAKGRREFATTQRHHRLEGFDFVKEVSAEHPDLPPPRPEHSLYPDWGSRDYAWGMVIDLDRCIGCNACVAACNVENNVLVVGKDQVAMGREMLWLRIDRYYSGDAENPRSFFQPVPCMHCEKAPCEMGCPVNAAVHNAEGLNQQVYNRCIGTRTCSSYCPYKVRRFNWFDYRHFDDASQAAHNPDVTVRSRGVMEKCTYCTQRIEAAHAAADKQRRKIGAGEVVTACQQACPTTAISFGNIKNTEEAVAKLRDSGRHYVLLEELGTRPRTTYLARWRDDSRREG